LLIPVGRVHIELILIERHRGPHRQLGQVGRKPAERHRFLVRAPLELIVRHTLEDFACGRHLLFEFGQ
jgi:hypothetical protein